MKHEGPIEGPLQGKVAVVTGGHRGLGLAMARGLLAAGARVSIWSRPSTAAMNTVADLGVHTAACDVRSPEQVQAALSATVSDLGSIDVVVSNAGVSVSRRILDLDAQSWADTMSTNLDGVLWTAQAVARQMVAQGRGGKIIVISSIRAGRASPTAMAYGASKAATEALVRSMAIGLAPHGIQVNAIRPGVMETEMTEPLRTNEALAAALLGPVPARRWGRPEDLTGLVTYLASAASDSHR